MQKPNGYDAAEAYTGDFESLPLGGHVCKIIGAKEETTTSGSPMLVIAFDIAEGSKYDGYYKKQHEHSKQTVPGAKWPNGGTYRQFTLDRDGNANSFFKGMITCIEKSNSGFKFDFDEKKLTGKLFGGVFGREQFEARDGSLKWSTKCVSIRSVETVKNGVEIPEDKLLKNSKSSSHSYSSDDFEEIPAPTDDDLPFC